jgi:hypothetical protein
MSLSMEAIKFLSKSYGISGDFSSWKIWISCMFIAVVEALTDQIDNLYLPVFLAFALHLL